MDDDFNLKSAKEQRDYLKKHSISFKNCERPETQIEHLVLEYQVEKIINNQPQLVYRKILPVFDETILSITRVFYNVPYWESELCRSGQYQITCLYPEFIHYTFIETGEQSETCFSRHTTASKVINLK